jgi:hypothetical protein
MDIEVFPILDNKNTIIDRIAFRMNTLPIYLYFPEPFTIENLGDIKVIDILSLIKQNITEKNFTSFYKNIKDILPKNISISRDIIYPWLYLSDIDPKKLTKGFILESLGISNKFNVEDKTIINILNKREVYKKALKARLNRFLTQTKEKLNELNNFIGLEGCDATDIKIKSFTLDINIHVDANDILNFFDKISLNERIPFVYCNNYYKLLKKFSLSPNWLNHKNIMEFRFCPLKNLQNATINDYIPIVVKAKTQKLSLILTTNSSPEYLEEKVILQEIMNIFSEEYKYTTEKIYTSEFTLNDSYFDYHVLAELAMNDPLVSSFLYINESSKATKKRLFVNLKLPNSNHITINLSNKLVKENLLCVVTIKGKNMKLLNDARYIMPKLCEYYTDKMKNIIQMYQILLDDQEFGIITIQEEDKKPEILSKKIKDIFDIGYVSKCSLQRRPVVIDEKVAKQLIDDGKSVFKFPRDKTDSDIQFPSDGINQQYYRCTNSEYPYFGLQKNTLINSDIYPYLPCCFVNDRTVKNNTDYYETKKLPSIQKSKQQQEIITDKILKYNPSDPQLGMLPIELRNFFSLVDNNTNYRFVRIGTNRTPRSFIDCLLKIRYGNNYSITVEDVIQNIIQHIELSKQCNYDTDIESIIKNVENENIYFDPKLYIQVMEYVFDINIILFSRNGIITPKYTHGYYTPTNLNDYVFIYEHMGSKSDRATYPQCEIIARNKINKAPVQLEFSQENKICKNILKIYHQITSAYSLSKPIQYVDFPLKLEITNQIIDSYGKLRQLTLHFQGKLITLFTEPIQPLPANLDTDNMIYPVDIKTGQQFSSNTNMTITEQVIENGKVVELLGIIGNVNVSIPIKKSNPITDLKISSSRKNYFVQSESYLSIYNKNEKFARYITEYLYWIFSIYISELDEKTEVNENILNSFSQEKFILDEKHIYNIIPENFSLQNNDIIKNQKIIVTSKEMIQKLMYVLKLKTIRDINELINYKDKINIHKYYNNISDFKQNNKQIILYGDDSVYNWILNSTSLNILRNNIDITTNSSYFFRNPTISTSILLAQNTDTIYKAIDISQTWVKNKYNKGIFAENIPIQIPYTLYAYQNSKNIKRHNIKGGNENIIIVGYKINNNFRYTSLLKL